MPVPLSPDPPLPMSVQDASRLLGSQPLLALIDYFRRNPRSTQAGAVVATGFNQQNVSRKTAELVDLGIAVVEVDPDNWRQNLYSVDMDKVAELLSAVTTYLYEGRDAIEPSASRSATTSE